MILDIAAIAKKSRKNNIRTNRAVIFDLIS